MNISKYHNSNEHILLLTITDSVKQTKFWFFAYHHQSMLQSKMNGYGRTKHGYQISYYYWFFWYYQYLFELVKLLEKSFIMLEKRLSTFHIELWLWLLLLSGNGMQAIGSRWCLIRNKTNPMGIFWRVSSP